MSYEHLVSIYYNRRLLLYNNLKQTHLKSRPLRVTQINNTFDYALLLWIYLQIFLSSSSHSQQFILGKHLF